MITIKYDGVDLVDAMGGALRINDIKGRGVSGRSISLIRTEGRDAQYLRSASTPPREIELTITIEAQSVSDLRDKVNALNGLLVRDTARPMAFSDEAFGFEYHAILSDTSSWDEVRAIGQGTLIFTCPDPAKYRQTTETGFLNGAAVVANNGQLPAKPLITVNVAQSSTYMSVSNEDGRFLQIGTQTSTEETPFQPLTMTADRLGNTLTGWTEGTVVDGGNVSGSFYTDGQAFRASTYGSGSGWHGPLLVQSLPSSLVDYRVEAFITLKQKAPTQVGRAEVYMLGTGGQRIGKLAMKWNGEFDGSNVGEVNIRKGSNSYNIIKTAGVRPKLWNDFYGILSIEKRGNTFTARIARIDNNVHNTVWTATFVDNNSDYNEPLAGIGIHLAQHGTKPFVQDMAIHRIRVYQVNTPGADAIPIIINPGDSVEFDFENSDIRINGRSRVDLKAIAGNYFPLKPGDNALFLDPPDIGEAVINFEEGFR